MGEDRAGSDQLAIQGHFRKEQEVRKETRGSSSRASARSCSSSSGGRAFICRTTSVSVSALNWVAVWPGGMAKLRRMQSDWEETVTNPDVPIGATSTDASSAREDVSQSVETRLLRSDMAPRFSNFVIRGPLADNRRDGFMPDRFANSPAGPVKSTASHTILCFDVRGAQNSANNIPHPSNALRHPRRKIYSFAVDEKSRGRRTVVRDMVSGAGWTFLSNHAHVLLCIAREPDVTRSARSPIGWGSAERARPADRGRHSRRGLSLPLAPRKGGEIATRCTWTAR